MADLFGSQYLLEHRFPGGNPSVSSRVLVVPNVGSVSTDQATATSIRFPFDARLPAYVEHSGVRGEPVVLQGVSGLEERYGTDRLGRAVLMSGPALYVEMREFLLAWAADVRELCGPFSRRVDTASPPQLILHLLGEGVSYVVGRYKLTTQRAAASSPTTYEWTLRIDSVARADVGKPPEDVIWGGAVYRNPSEKSAQDNARDKYVVQHDESGEVTKLFAPEADELDVPPGPLREANDADVYTAARNAGREVDDALSTVARVEGRVRSYKGALDRSIESIGNLRRDVDRAVGFPAAVLTSAYATATAFRLEVEGYRDLVDGHTEKVAYGRAAAAALRLERVFHRAFARAGKVIPPRSGDPSIGSPEGRDRVVVLAGRPVSVAILRAGETLGDLAERELGDRAAWREIAVLNGITDPWKTNLGVPIGTGGFALYIPRASGPDASRTGGVDVFGDTWAVDDDGQLSWRDGAFDRVSGPASVVQTLKVRYRTLFATVPAWPQGGLQPVVGLSSAEAEPGRIAVDVKAQTLRDRRVGGVERLRLVRDGDMVVVDGDVTLADGSSVPVSVPVIVGGT